MIPREVLKKIRRIQITTAKKATDVFAGEYKSIFKGKGLEFAEVREYLPGDEIRTIDWNVSARMGRPFVKKFVEERELTIMLLLDASASTDFGTVNRLKRELAAEVCAVLGASANRNNDKVGLIVFTDKIETFLPPRKGTFHMFRVIREALYHVPQGKGTDIQLCLKYLDRVTKKRTVAFMISDFYGENLRVPLSIANKRHDIVAVHVVDPREKEMPEVGLVRLDDLESGESVLFDTAPLSAREEYRRIAKAKATEIEKLCYSVKIDRIEISTDKPYEKALISFFSNRKARRNK